MEILLLIPLIIGGLISVLLIGGAVIVKVLNIIGRKEGDE